MKIKFWGVRGSLPTPPTAEHIRDKFIRIIDTLPPAILAKPDEIKKYILGLSNIEAGLIGGNTPCIEIRASDKILIFDMGSGIKALGNYLVKNEPNKNGLDLHIFITHTHWDHIHGFPFFTPAFFPNNKLTFYSPHPNLKERLEVQQDFRFFPVSLEHMPAKKEFVLLEHNSTINLGEVKISNHPLYHPGGSFSYRIEWNGKSIVYATDSEYKNLDRESTKQYIDFFRGADLLIFDAQYTFEEAIHKEDWGHSSALVGVEFAVEAGVKRLALFHHEPERNDFEIQDILKKSIDFKKINFPKQKLDIFLAMEGLEIYL
ncbi:MAG: MBL fold metallo-hydrolase [Candidatus Marinimicrobia bacterium]|jgi:phosphoribosyl 1,2-cyclic phosphodiesterase|nr:MBL fold metallo-hydrolase [Candidatus Neomarinimicrobiota bacterium]MCK9483106.1 MBL fold metallo-hydrolase [Candidatus Neomarinimicrobiota bacterium]MCK9560581.1 MBL fold metallo-hydrolase [Candidatus Neomarinimicrobiota bacterium]MDD5061247.1 MBL fold metallo-hydrolase [Candidatus Neomarinimicrobiota bacterium]MDD5231251.1 MBL fold metallo-hydrolase [Candidatus Neomarinimicrobiota bacterium]